MSAGIVWQPSCRDAINRLAEKYSLVKVADKNQLDYALCFSKQQLFLHANEKALSFSIDFNAVAFTRRLKQAHLKNEILAKAIYCKKPLIETQVIDVTAGLGFDAMLLSAMGFSVLAIEKNALLAALLDDGLKRLVNFPAFSLLHADSIIFLQQLAKEKYPDVIYLDPMFERDRKTALSNKRMQILQQLLTKEDNTALFFLAKKVARKKLVVKRSLRSDYLAGERPNYSLKGRSHRFDIYCH